MASSTKLFLYEELMLLALRNEKGTLKTEYARYALAGALLAEMLLEGRIAVDGGRRKLVDVVDARPMGDPILDECLSRIAEASRRAPLKTWVMRLASTKKLRHRAAQQLCRRGILRADEDTVLLFFRRKIYPELNPMPERRIVERMRMAVVSGTRTVDPRTMMLISLTKGAGLLAKTLGRDDVKRHKDRIKQIIQGEATGNATRQVIEACRSAAMVAAIMPGVIASTSASHH